MNKIIAYCDGSYHVKSDLGGWSYLIYDNNKLINQDFGEIPKEYRKQYEEYAFYKLIKYLKDKEYSDVLIYSDSLDLIRKFERNKINEIIKIYDSEISIDNINIIMKWLPSKENKNADKLSRKFLETIYKKEIEIFKNAYSKNHINGNIKNEKIEFFMADKVKSVVTSMIKYIEKKFINYHKFDSLIIELYEEKSIYNLRISTYKNNEFTIIDESLLEMNSYQEKLIESLKANKNKKILLSVTTNNGLFEEITGLNNPSPQFEKFKENFNQILKDNTIEKIIIHNKLINKQKIELKKKNKPSLDNKINIVKGKKFTNKVFGRLVSLEIAKYKQENQKEPTLDEKATIIKKIKIQ